MDLKTRLDGGSVKRAVRTYQVPDSFGGTIRSISLIELTAEEEVSAADRASSNKQRFAYELIKAFIVEVNGSPVTLADGSADSVLQNMSPKLRSLLTEQYARMHTATKKEEEDFFKSEVVETR